jgi:DNA-binding SARP family transcriptional activator
MTDFRVLGPLEAVGDGEPVALPAGKPRALLARLLLDAPRVVGVETLIDALWGTCPPASARKVLQVYVSQLRKALGRERIETRAPGYLLRASAEETDLGRFTQLAETARLESDPARRARLLHDALKLWRGPGLVEFSEPFAGAAARRLAELRLMVLEQRIDAELELGRHERLVGELEQLVAEEPLRERTRRQLMLALYRSGRQAEALARYREGRRLLVDELGIEPEAGLQQLERAILRQDPGLGEPERTPARGCVVCAEPRLHGLVAPLCADGRELVLVAVAADASELAARTAELARIDLGARTASFTSASPGDDLARLAEEQGAELLVTGPLASLPPTSCDLAIAARPQVDFRPEGPVLVPFGGGREEWAALELGAWLARAHGLPLRLLGSEAREGRRDASRTLASASLALQRFAETSAEPVLVPPGSEGILAQQGSVIAASLPAGELDATRRALVERSTVPVLLVRAGLRPGGLAPERTLTRFSWSLSDP